MDASTIGKQFTLNALGLADQKKEVATMRAEYKLSEQIEEIKRKKYLRR
jgi:hypothetical protein